MGNRQETHTFEMAILNLILVFVKKGEVHSQASYLITITHFYSAHKSFL